MALSRISTKSKSANQRVIDHTVGTGNVLTCSIQASTSDLVASSIGVAVGGSGITGSLMAVDAGANEFFPFMKVEGLTDAAISEDKTVCTFDGGVNLYKTVGSNKLVLCMDHGSTPQSIWEVDAGSFAYPVFYKINPSTHARHGRGISCSTFPVNTGFGVVRHATAAVYGFSCGATLFSTVAISTAESATLTIAGASAKDSSPIYNGDLIFATGEGTSDNGYTTIVTQDPLTLILEGAEWATVNDPTSTGNNLTTISTDPVSLILGSVFTTNWIVMWTSTQLYSVQRNTFSYGASWAAKTVPASLPDVEIELIWYDGSNGKHWIIKMVDGTYWGNDNTAVELGTYTQIAMIPNGTELMTDTGIVTMAGVTLKTINLYGASDSGGVNSHLGYIDEASGEIYYGGLSSLSNVMLTEVVKGQQHVDLSGRVFNADEDIYVTGTSPLAVTLSGVEGTV